MSDTNGKLVAVYEVHCAICEKFANGLGKTAQKAAAELKSFGWREHQHLGWICDDCISRTGRTAN